MTANRITDNSVTDNNPAQDKEDKDKEDKEHELKAIRSALQTKLSEEERMLEMGTIVSGLLCTITSRLVRDTGYSVASKILKRDLQHLAHENTQRIRKALGLEANTPENVSKVLKITALLLGLRLDTEGKETIVKQCPLATVATEFREPFFCNICSEYCNAVVREILGPKYGLETGKSLVRGDPYCAFQTKERV